MPPNLSPGTPLFRTSASNIQPYPTVSHAPAVYLPDLTVAVPAVNMCSPLLLPLELLGSGTWAPDRSGEGGAR